MGSKKLFGLIGFPLGHSFSKKYFTEKFEKLSIQNSHEYELFELENLTNFPSLIEKHKDSLVGLNVTIPHKKNIINYLKKLDPAAREIGAVNTIKFLPNGELKGYNTDYWGFRNTLESWDKFNNFKDKSALILGQGGASKAIIIALKDLGIDVIKVSRKESVETISYEQIPKFIKQVGLIVNCTPLGMHPNIETFPPIPYELLNKNHFLYDIVYNPTETLFLKKGLENGVGGIYYGLPMLHGQAEKAWEIWNKF